MSDKEASPAVSLMGGLLAVPLGVAIALPFAILDGWAIKTMWWWFAVPALHVPALATTQAMGLAMIVSVFRYKSPKGDKRSFGAVIEGFATRAGTIMVLVGLAYLLHLWMASS